MNETQYDVQAFTYGAWVTLGTVESHETAATLAKGFGEFVRTRAVARGGIFHCLVCEADFQGMAHHEESNHAGYYEAA